MNSTNVTPITDAEHYTAMAVIYTYSFAGLALCISVGLALRKDPLLFKSFAFLCMCQSAADAGVFLFHMAFTLPVLALRTPTSLTYNWVWHRYITAFPTVFTNIQIGLVIVIAANRYWAIARPLQYRVKFTLENCRKYAAVCTILPLVIILPIDLQCPAWMDTDNYMLAFDITPQAPQWGGIACGFTIQLIWLTVESLQLIAILLTILSVIALRKNDKDKATPVDPKLRPRQVRTLTQSALNCILQFSLFCFLMVLTPLLMFNGFRLTIMFTTVGAHMSAHLIHSVVLFVYNKSVRDWILRCGKAKVADEATGITKNSDL